MPARTPDRVRGHARAALEHIADIDDDGVRAAAATAAHELERDLVALLEHQHFNGLTPVEAELLAWLSEECAEVIHVVAKIQRHGLDSCDPADPTHTANIELLHRELEHVRAATILLARAGVVEVGLLPKQAADKLARVGKYLHHAQELAR